MRKDNPYNLANIVNIDFPEQQLLRKNFRHIASPDDKIHIVRDWDTIWDIAFDYYGNPHYYFLIQDINKLESPLELPPVGKTLIIPSLQVYMKYL